MKQLVAYITSCYPDKELSIDIAHSLSENGVDFLELGVPFSDPVADGPIIEEANLKALQNGFKMVDLFEISKKITPKIETFWMGYFNPFYHKGIDYICTQAKICNVSGFLIPDLPFEEAKTYRNFMDNMGLTLIDFIAPTDNEKRVEKIVLHARKFIYLVAYAGITGSGKSEDLGEIIANIKKYTHTSVFVGFGVNEKTAKEKAKNADGVIVGSAFVKVLLDDGLTGKEKIAKISSLARNIKNMINE